MNVLHSRRKRERERIEIEVLHEQCDDMRSRNKDLVQENSQLEHMLKTAQSFLLQGQSSIGDKAMPGYFMPPPHVGTRVAEKDSENGGYVHTMPTPMQQTPQGMVPMYSPQAYVPQGQFFMTAAPGGGASYCMMPAGSMMAPDMKAQGFQFQQMPQTGQAQQQYYPVVDMQYQGNAPMYVQVPVQPMPYPPVFLLFLRAAYAVPVVPTTDRFSPFATTGSPSTSIAEPQNLATTLPENPIVEQS